MVKKVCPTSSLSACSVEQRFKSNFMLKLFKENYAPIISCYFQYFSLKVLRSLKMLRCRICAAILTLLDKKLNASSLEIIFPAILENNMKNMSQRSLRSDIINHGKILGIRRELLNGRFVENVQRDCFHKPMRVSRSNSGLPH